MVKSRPKVILSAAITIDGKIASKTAKNSWNLHVNYSKDLSPKNKQTGEKVSMPFQLESGLHYSHFLNS